ncbi:uncharacterized protein BYT42DRAFT_579440 [Radiomyces spectabilis]|uniref:uncharacterized protein n=1 Tax=Radiomyces spectabilis TaxID=64574 RepID=UPI00222105D9|nr:uncharacterized protein BYT42DRAFT_579440 [Radiomyces spectabilis]KAI8373169.1 hypothetical protein BYT42DRAFT_579440 [Radiomyces spectabilis]
MSIATLAPNLALPSNNDIPSLVVGESRSYYFYEKLSISNTSSSTKYQHRNKPIIPSIPRERM